MMKGTNTAILVVGVIAAWYLNNQLEKVEEQFAEQAHSEIISQGASFWNLASMGHELEIMKYALLQSLPVFFVAFAIIGVLVYLKLCSYGLNKNKSVDG